MEPVLSVVVPVYNEEEVLTETYRRLASVMSASGIPYELVFVNDGSRDKSLDMLRTLTAADENVRVVSFSRNFGHQAAITAGMSHAAGEAIVVIDADLQDPPELIPAMAEKWREGFDVVYGKRTKRKGETAFKKVTAGLYYRILREMTNVEIPVDAGDFRLISRTVRDALLGLRERNRYVRGLVSWVGFKQCALEYVREERFAGETKYPLSKMIKLSLDGIAAFSNKPLKLPVYLGAPALAAGLICLLVIIIRAIAGLGAGGVFGAITAILITQGLVLISLGIVGEYLWRVLDEVRGRPVYIVKETLGYKDTAGKDTM